MFIDARQLPPQHALRADVCVIGAGPAGITLALELADGPNEVLLLESGGFEFDPATQALYDGAVTGRDYFPLKACRLRFFSPKWEIEQMASHNSGREVRNLLGGQLFCCWNSWLANTGDY